MNTTTKQCLTIQEYVTGLEPRERERWMRVHSALARGGGRRIVNARDVRVGDTIDVLQSSGTTRAVDSASQINGGMLQITAGTSYYFRVLPSDQMVIVCAAR